MHIFLDNSTYELKVSDVMQIALTKKLANELGINSASPREDENPLFSWTANWTNVWDNHRKEDMLVLVNNATRFTVAIYQVKRKDLRNVAEMMRTAIINTLLALNINPELVEEYLHLAGEVEFSQNRSRQTASWVTKAGLECAFIVGDEYNGIAKMFSDTVGVSANYLIVSHSGGSINDSYFPYQAMIKALSELTGKQAYKCRAFELMVTLDLDIYKAVRRIIVPSNLEFAQLHKVLQSVFDWKNYHLYDFTIFDGNNKQVARLVPFEEDLEYDEGAILMKEHNLSKFLPEHEHMVYTYDMGDNWKHKIQLVNVIEEYDKELPYLLEAIGQTPPEDVGGIRGFLDFREIMLDPIHPDYALMKEWAGFWTPELSDWEKSPKVIHF